MAATLNSRIPMIIAKLDDETFEGMVAFAEKVAEGAKERVPDAPPTGSGLVSAIHIEADESKLEVSVVAGDNEHFYGHFLELGTTRTSPRPFLIPAFEAERPNLNEIASEYLGDL